MKKFTLALLLFIFIFSGAIAQNYKTGLGIRTGWGNGITVKHFIGESTALEGILNTQWKGFSFTGLLEFHKPLLNSDNLNWFYGAGGHVGFWDGKYNSRFDSGTNTVVGLVGILGAELSLNFIPISVSIDWKPSLALVNSSGFWGDGGALSIRYTF